MVVRQLSSSTELITQPKLWKRSRIMGIRRVCLFVFIIVNLLLLNNKNSEHFLLLSKFNIQGGP